MMTKKDIDIFGPTARAIVHAAKQGPVNPYNYFRHSLRRSWSYAYFERLWIAGLLKLVPTPEGRRGHHWYIAT